jgi:hypothetical protein
MSILSPGRPASHSGFTLKAETQGGFSEIFRLKNNQ